MHEYLKSAGEVWRDRNRAGKTVLIIGAGVVIYVGWNYNLIAVFVMAVVITIVVMALG
jgi:hypothetical protein